MASVGPGRRYAGVVGLMWGTAAASAVFGVALTVLLGRRLGASDYGRIALVLTIANLADQLFSFRSAEAVTRYLSLALSRGDRGAAARVVWLGYAVDLTAAVVAGAALFFLADLVATGLLHQPQLGPLLRLYAGAVVVAFVGPTSAAVLRVCESFRWLAIARISGAASRFLLVALALIAEGTLASVMLAYVGAALVESSMVAGLSTWRLRHALPPRAEGAVQGGLAFTRRDIFRTLLHTNLTGTLKVGTEGLGVLLLGRWWGVAHVGWYRAARQLAQVVGLLQGAIYEVLYPQWVRAVQNNTWAAAWSQAIQYSRRLLLPSVLGIALLAPLSGMVLSVLLGREFRPAALDLVLIAGGYAAAIVGTWAQPMAVASGRASVPNEAWFAAVLFWVVGSFILIRPFGHVAVAAMFLVTQVAIHLWTALRLRPERARDGGEPVKAA